MITCKNINWAGIQSGQIIVDHLPHYINIYTNTASPSSSLGLNFSTCSSLEISSWAGQAYFLSCPGQADSQTDRLTLTDISVRWTNHSVAVSRCGPMIDGESLPAWGELSDIWWWEERAGCDSGLFYKTSYGVRPDSLFQLPSDQRTTKLIILPSDFGSVSTELRGKSHLRPEPSAPSPYYLQIYVQVDHKADLCSPTYLLCPGIHLFVHRKDKRIWPLVFLNKVSHSKDVRLRV